MLQRKRYLVVHIDVLVMIFKLTAKTNNYLPWQHLTTFTHSSFGSRSHWDTDDTDNLICPVTPSPLHHDTTHALPSGHTHSHSPYLPRLPNVAALFKKESRPLHATPTMSTSASAAAFITPINKHSSFALPHQNKLRLMRALQPLSTNLTANSATFSICTVAAPAIRKLLL